MKVKTEVYEDKKLRFVLALVLVAVNVIIFSCIAAIAITKNQTEGLLLVLAILGGITLASVSKLYVENIKE